MSSRETERTLRAKQLLLIVPAGVVRPKNIFSFSVSFVRQKQNRLFFGLTGCVRYFALLCFVVDERLFYKHGRRRRHAPPALLLSVVWLLLTGLVAGVVVVAAVVVCQLFCCCSCCLGLVVVSVVCCCCYRCCCFCRGNILGRKSIDILTTERAVL